MKDKLIDFYTEFTSLEGTLFRYSLSFSFLLAIAPALIILVFIFNSFHVDVSIISDLMSRFIPADLIQPFITFITAKGYTSVIAVLWSLGLSFWLASRSSYGLALISAKMEGIHRKKTAIRIKAIFLFVFLILVITATVLASTFLPGLTRLIFILVLFVGLTLLYKVISFYKRPKRFGIIGAAFATAGISLTGLMFIKLVDIFTSYESVYGPLASLIVLLLSVWIVATILYIGFLLNIVMYREDLVDENKQVKSGWFFDWRTDSGFRERFGSKNRSRNRAH